MEYVADTVAIVRYFAKKGHIPSRALRIFRDADDGKHTIAISVMSLIEILYLSERRRIPIDLDKLKTELDEQSNYRIIHLDSAIVNTARSVHGGSCADLPLAAA